MTDYRFLVVTEGIWYDSIASGRKKFDFRKGYRDINVGDAITFAEADAAKKLTGRTCTFKVNLVLHSHEFPDHFNWNGPEFTIIQFEENRI